MNAITTTPEQSGSTALAQPMSLREGLAASRSSMIENGDAPDVNDFVRFSKQGEWLFGDENRGDKPLNGRRALFDSNRIQHGWICWGKDEGGKPKKLADFMRPVNIPVPEDSSPFDDHAGGTWMKQKVLSARFLDGDMEQFRWGVTSKGGFGAVGGLMDAIMAQIDIGGATYPIVELASGSYKHPQFGKVMVPITRIVGWSGPGGPNFTPEPAPLPVDKIGRLDDEIPFGDSGPAPVKGRAGK